MLGDECAIGRDGVDKGGVGVGGRAVCLPKEIDREVALMFREPVTSEIGKLEWFVDVVEAAERFLWLLLNDDDRPHRLPRQPDGDCEQQHERTHKLTG